MGADSFVAFFGIKLALDPEDEDAINRVAFRKQIPISSLVSVVLMLLVTGCVAPNPQEQARAIQNHSYWSQWAANKHRAIKTFGQPDDTSYMRRYERGYRTVVLTWFDLKTPDGKEWSKVSLPFYNYAPDFELHETSFVGMLPQIPK